MSDRPPSGNRSPLTTALAAEDGVGARDALTQARGDGEALEELARAAADGSRTAVELLVEELDGSGLVHALAARSLLDRSAVDDVAQDALISVALSIGSFNGTAKVTTWVHQIVRNRVVDHLRRQRATVPLPPDDLAPAARMSSMIATRATVRDALGALPELYRAPVTLRDVDGLSYDDIARRLGRNLGTVKVQISRGRAMLAASLRPTEMGE